MELSEVTKQRFTELAEDLPKIKELGYNEGFEAGKQKEWSDFWIRFTNNGKRTMYNRAFYNTIMDGITIDANLCKPVSTNQMFYNSEMTELPKGIDFSKRDTTAADTGWNGNVGREFQWANVTYVYDIHLQPSAAIGYMFSNCEQLETIEILRVKEETTYSSTFANCKKLKNITFEGVVGQNISFSSSPLSVDSMKSVITHLKDYSGTTSEYTYTVTFKTSAFETLEASDEKSPNGNTWAEYIDDLKWNLVKA